MNQPSTVNCQPAAGTPAAEVEITDALVRDLLRAQHPDLAHLPITPMESGWDNAMFRIGEEFAARLPRRALAAPLIEREQKWLPTLASRLPLRVPAPVRIGSPDCGYPWRWSIVEWLPGAPADRSPPAADQGVVLARFLEALHAPAPREAPRNPYRGVPLADRAVVVGERIARLERTDGVLDEHVKRAWGIALETPIDASPTWIHGDLHARNALVEDGRLVAVIDWGDVAQGDRATDLAAIWAFLPTASARRAAIATLSRVSEATWRRARGWAVFFGVTLLDTGLVSDACQAAGGRAMLTRLAEDGARERREKSSWNSDTGY